MNNDFYLRFAYMHFALEQIEVRRAYEMMAREQKKGRRKSERWR